jgi:hypothetical protein
MKPQQLWFKAKLYGWGWYPATWQGWVVTLSYVALLIGLAVLREKNAPQPNTFFDAYTFIMVILTITLIAICYRTGEKPRWRWGK